MTLTITAARSDMYAPPNPYAYGYGPKIPTAHWVRVNGETRWRRVYVAQYGNAGSAWITYRGASAYIDEHELFAALPAFETVGTGTVSA